jgi:hypothetical protein
MHAMPPILRSVQPHGQTRFRRLGRCGLRHRAESPIAGGSRAHAGRCAVPDQPVAQPSCWQRAVRPQLVAIARPTLVHSQAHARPLRPDRLTAISRPAWAQARDRHTAGFRGTADATCHEIARAAGCGHDTIHTPPGRLALCGQAAPLVAWQARVVLLRSLLLVRAAPIAEPAALL